MHEDDSATPEEDPLAVRWGLPRAELPHAVAYLHVRILETEGDLELVEIQYRPGSERYRYRVREAPADEAWLEIERPQGWDRAREAQALADLLRALAEFSSDDDRAA
jgi:hypothetical protein